MPTPYTVPGMQPEQAERTRAALQERLTALLDLGLTLKHVHWNVVGPNFISVHEMLDPQVESVRGMVDTTAERIATLGGEPLGTPGNIVKIRTWNDYAVNRATTQEHLAALDGVYVGVIEDHRKAITLLGELDPISEGMLIEQAEQLELYHWFVRAHLEDRGGNLAHGGARDQESAVRAVGN